MEVQMEVQIIISQLFLVILLFNSSYAVINCPYHPPEEGDAYNVKGRHEKLKADFGGDGTSAKTVSKTHKRRDDADNYEYKISLCGSTFVSQTDVNTKKIVNIGRYNESLMSGGVDWLIYTFGGGKKYNSHCQNADRKTMLIVKCNDGSTDSSMHVIEEGRIENEDAHLSNPTCYYLFEYNHSAACSPKPKKLSAGSIVCILLVSLSVAYLAFGMLYKRFVSQAKGFEQIPNYNFWVQLGNLSADGCDIVCRRSHQPANSYKGMADALNIDSSDDEKDDTLLPM